MQDPWQMALILGSALVAAGCSESGSPGASDASDASAPSETSERDGDSRLDAAAPPGDAPDPDTDDETTPDSESPGRDTVDGDTEGTDEEDLIWRMRHDDVPPESEKPFEQRDRDELQRQLKARGWDHANYHVKDGVIYSSEHAREGSHSLGFFFSEEDAREEDDRMGFVLRKSIDRDEAWVQFWLKFEEGFDVTDNDFKGGVDWADGGKITGWGGGVDHECDACRGIDGWTALITFHDPDRAGYTPHDTSGKILLNYYVYHADNTGYGDTFAWTKNDAGLLESGRWYEITVHARMNDVGRSNGILEAWVDGTKAYERRNWQFRKEGHKDLRVGPWRHGSWFGGGWYPPKEQTIYTDDLRVYGTNPLSTQ